MSEKEKDIDSVYDGEGSEHLVEDDEISPEEEAFMQGYTEEQEKKEKKHKGDEAYEQAFSEKKKK
jgi:hypothetical protein